MLDEKEKDINTKIENNNRAISSFVVPLGRKEYLKVKNMELKKEKADIQKGKAELAKFKENEGIK